MYRAWETSSAEDGRTKVEERWEVDSLCLHLIGCVGYGASKSVIWWGERVEDYKMRRI